MQSSLPFSSNSPVLRIYLNSRKVTLPVGRCLCKGPIIHVCTSEATLVLLPAALASRGAAVPYSPWPAPTVLHSPWPAPTVLHSPWPAPTVLHSSWPAPTVLQSPWPAPADDADSRLCCATALQGTPLSCLDACPTAEPGAGSQVLGQRADAFHVLTQTLTLSSRKLHWFIFTSSTSELPTEHAFPHIRC